MVKYIFLAIPGPEKRGVQIAPPRPTQIHVNIGVSFASFAPFYAHFRLSLCAWEVLHLGLSEQKL